MRVIAGTLKGRRLESPAWAGLRPTSDRLRETLFNVLGPRIAGARFLDGYAGTGAVGIEAMSRGAAMVTFVESDRRAVALIARNLRRCGLEDGYAIIRAGFIEAAGTRLPAAGCDLVWLDPPYETADLVGPLEAAAGLTTAGGLVLLEHARRRGVPLDITGLASVRTVRSGDSTLALFERTAPGA